MKSVSPSNNPRKIANSISQPVILIVCSITAVILYLLWNTNGAMSSSLTSAADVYNLGTGALITRDEHGQIEIVEYQSGSVVHYHYEKNGLSRTTVFCNEKIATLLDFTRDDLMRITQVEKRVRLPGTEAQSKFVEGKTTFTFGWNLDDTLASYSIQSTGKPIEYPKDTDPTMYLEVFRTIAEHIKQLARQKFEVNSGQVKVNVGVYDGVVVTGYNQDTYALQVKRGPTGETLLVQNLNKSQETEVDLTTGIVSPTREFSRSVYHIPLKGPMSVTGYETDDVRVFGSSTQFTDNQWVLELLLARQFDFY